MANEPENEDEELLLDTPAEDEPEAEAVETPEPADEPDDDIEIRFGDEAEEPAEGDNDLVRHLRKELRERDRRLAEVSKQQVAPEKITVGPRPTMEDAEYDQERYDQMVDAWITNRDRAKEQESEAEKQQRAATEQWQGTLNAYSQKKAALARPDFQEAEDAFASAIDPVRQAVILSGADDPAKVIYALGRSPQRAAELAKITDPIKFAFAVAKLEKDLKVTIGKRKAPEPEQIARGSASLATSNEDKRMAEMERRAEKSGDRSEIVRYRREQREKGASK